MQRLLTPIESLERISDIYDFVLLTFETLGVVRQSYHVTPWGCLPNSMSITLVSAGFPEEWLNRYADPNFRLNDPIPARIMKHGSMMKWTDAMLMEPNTQEQEEFFEAMREFGLIHGCGLPVYGPNDKDFYASFDFGRPIEEISPMNIGIIRAVAQTAHQRISILSERELALPKLSQREAEVLQWISRGKSSSEIAIILGLSMETVKTYTKRLFAKLDVHDRISLVIKASQHGLLRA